MTRREITTGLLKAFLIYWAVFFAFSPIVLIIQGDDSDKWFSRLVICVIATGFWYIGERLKEIRDVVS